MSIALKAQKTARLTGFFCVVPMDMWESPFARSASLFLRIADSVSLLERRCLCGFNILGYNPLSCFLQLEAVFSCAGHIKYYCGKLILEGYRVDLSLVQDRDYKDTFAGGDYDMDIEVNVGLRLSDTKAGPETEEETLRLLLKTDRQKRLYEEVQKRCQPRR